VIDTDAILEPVGGLEARLAQERNRRAAAHPDDDTSALDAEIARLERALEAMWRR
jgi:hypothetical protein